jgi:hypothetical protein
MTLTLALCLVWGGIIAYVASYSFAGAPILNQRRRATLSPAGSLCRTLERIV